jgi:hypothetical protein
VNKNAQRTWALEEFGNVDLGDRRRKRRLIDIAAAVAVRPTSIVAEAFTNDAGRQGAYDFLESRLVAHGPIEQSMGESCAARCAVNPFVIVPVDGSTISLADRSRKKSGLGSTGHGGGATDGRGLKALSAIAVDSRGVPIGVAGQDYWARPHRARMQHRLRKNLERKRPRDEREIQHWVAVIRRVKARFNEAGAKAWFVLDREGDAHAILRELVGSDHLFTVRASHDRVVDETVLERGTAPRPRGPNPYERLRSVMERQPILGRYTLDVAEGPHRIARKATLTIRTHTLSLRIRIKDDHRVDVMPVSVVWVREEGSTPTGEKPLDWMLFTNYSVASIEDAKLVIHGYTQRWRIEEFHRTWKSGGCGVEQTQLRSADAIIKWATLLAAVAVRVERLKYLARNEPDRPATIELSKYELRALVLLKRREKKRTEEIEDDPTISVATRWIAELGGYTGKSSGGPPGAVTIGRGLERIQTAAAALEQLALERGQ